MNGIFTPVLLKQLSERFRSVAETIVDRVSNQPSIDAVRDLVQPYILDVFGDAVGLPREGRHHLIPFGVAAINTFGPPNELFYQLVSQSSEGIPWVDAQCTSSTLAPDALGGLLYEASERGEVSKEEASLLMRNVLAAGVDTTVGVTANMLHAFARNPDQWELLRSNPKLAQAAFDEVQRWYSPSRMFGRVAHRDIELAGTTIAKDQGVLLFVAATGRDPRAWDEPERFDIRRSAGKHLSFGFGIHYCLGQMLARYEVLALLSVLIEKVVRIDASGVPQALMNNTVQSFSSLPLRFELAPAGRD